MQLSGGKRGRPADSPLVKAEKAMDAAEDAWRDARMSFNEKAHHYKSIAWWEAESIVERAMAAAIKAGHKMDEKESQCWVCREAYVRVREDGAAERARVYERRVSEMVKSRVVARAAERTAVEVSIARYPWREEVLEMAEACPDITAGRRIQRLHAQGVL